MSGGADFVDARSSMAMDLSRLDVLIILVTFFDRLLLERSNVFVVGTFMFGCFSDARRFLARVLSHGNPPSSVESKEDERVDEERVSSTSRWLVETAKEEADRMMEALRDQIVVMDGKAQQLLAMLVTIATVLAGASAGLALSGGVPIYAVAIPGLGALWTMIGIQNGLSAIKGDMTILGSLPSGWFRYAKDEALETKVLQARLRALSRQIGTARRITRKQHRKIEQMKSNAFWAVIGVITCWCVFAISDEVGFRPVPALFMQWRALKSS